MKWQKEEWEAWGWALCRAAGIVLDPGQFLLSRSRQTYEVSPATAGFHRRRERGSVGCVSFCPVGAPYGRRTRLMGRGLGRGRGKPREIPRVGVLHKLTDLGNSGSQGQGLSDEGLRGLPTKARPGRENVPAPDAFPPPCPGSAVGRVPAKRGGGRRSLAAASSGGTARAVLCWAVVTASHCCIPIPSPDLAQARGPGRRFVNIRELPD